METFDSLRKDARALEQSLEYRLQAFSRLGDASAIVATDKKDEGVCVPRWNSATAPHLERSGCAGYRGGHRENRNLHHLWKSAAAFCYDGVWYLPPR
jgi:hypothetical protein